VLSEERRLPAKENDAADKPGSRATETAPVTIRVDTGRKNPSGAEHFVFIAGKP